MTKCAPLWRLLLSLFLVIFFVGCSQFRRAATEDDKDPHVIDGKRRLSALDIDGAIESFERALQSNPRNAVAHFELGVIYEKKNDFAAAIYHFQRHLTINTNSNMAGAAKDRITSSKQELARTASFSVVNRNVQYELERLVSTNDLLKRRIAMLEEELRRPPRYITNYVTNFLKFPEFEQRGSRSLTKSTEIVDPPIRDESPPTVQQSDDSDPPPASSRRTPRETPSNTRQGSASRNAATDARRTQQPAAPRTQAVHTVRPGDTLQVLASRYGVTVKQLRAANPGIGSGTRAGQKINIPEK